MKKSYFIWLAIHCIVWVLAFSEFGTELIPRQLTGMSIYLVLLFIVPLFKENPLMQTILFCVQALLTILIFYPMNNELSQYGILIQSLIMAEAVFYLSRSKSLIVIAVQLASAAVILILSSDPISKLVWCALYYLLLVVALLYHQVIHNREKEARMSNEALLEEYRKMKRQLLVEEQQARQDERMLIGHEIHDSVGHKLTALLFQFEAFRLTAAEKDKETIGKLKELAEQSLEETWQAVRSFKQSEVGGLQGVIRLIRKLEIESFMKINFSVKHGAFAAPLTGEQSFAIYRAVQEALTNIMKHSSSREAQVIFEAPGGSIFRFEVVNAATHDRYFQEGYGLKAMRERLEKVGGTLEIEYETHHFLVRGTIRLADWGGSDD
ncbi:histidine kinase [Terribacillus saccharophilus]|uniref:sensor histidine kinase n=1 Tax=Terribacillus saccharophilus TaxID=361277 RepID=UPI000BA76CCC|nr:histidine kinase [Terribacillus saccharophilus]PAF34852.1 histidine kinase [Terribacillus saccharophilus]